MTTAAFIEILRPHYEDAARYCRLLCASWSATTAEDVFQQALLQAFEQISTLREPARFRPWLFRIILRCFQQERRRSFWRRFTSLHRVDQEAETLYAPYEDHGWKQALLVALAQLTPKARNALLLHEVAGFSLQEVAALQGDRSLSAVKMRLHRARAQMRTLLSEDAPPAPSASSITDLTDETLRLVSQYQENRGGSR